MNTTRFERLHRIFDEAAKLAPSQWESYLTNACGGDEELLGEARKLLAVCMQATPSDTSEYSAPSPAQMIGPYRVVRQIGSGGMGVVFLAVRDDGAFRKNVAVKLLRSHLVSTDLVQRFHQERQVLANLDHPNIARILDGGQTADGMPYYVMEFVDGQPLDRFCDSQTLDLADRIRLFQQLVRAVQYLHENLVVHRDL
jgi:serine/threonine-protein kinase